MHDNAHDLNVVSALAPAARTASANGSAIDLQGYDSATVVFATGAWTDGTHTPKIQESDDGSTNWTDVAAGDLVLAFSAVSSSAGQNAVQRQGYVGYKRYIRPVLTISGATTGMLSSASVIRGRSIYKPAA